MSNCNILLRLKERFLALVAGQIHSIQFEEYLEHAIQALEGVDDETIERARHFGYLLVVMGFADMDHSVEPPERVIHDFRLWLADLKAANCSQQELQYKGAFS